VEPISRAPLLRKFGNLSSQEILVVTRNSRVTIRPSVRPSVRLSASQSHQFKVAYTGYNPVLNPVFLAQNQTFTRVVAEKQAKSTKVKNKFVNGKKSSKEYSAVFLVEGESSI